MKLCRPPLVENLASLIHTAKKLWVNRKKLKQVLVDKIVFFFLHLTIEIQS